MIDKYRYSIQLFLEEQHEKLISDLISEFRLKGLVNSEYLSDSYRPHISLSVYKELDEDYAYSAISQIAEKFSSFEISFSHIGIFNGDTKVLFLSPIYTDTLRQIHKDLHEHFNARPEVSWDYYAPEKWVPHCALLIDSSIENILKAARFKLVDSLILSATIESISVVGFGEDKVLKL